MMTPEQIEQVFGRGRLKMATGDHVEVFREALMPGERRRYTKRFLATSAGDFGPWTAREWRILARLIGHGIQCVPDVVQFDGGAQGGARLVQTYDAGITVDQWGTLLPVARRRQRHPHIFEDCAHWWSLAHHCLVALDEIHALGLVHLDIKGDNICIPYGPSDFDPAALQSRLYPEFGRLALIDFAFSLVSRESLAMPLPIGWQKDYDYQSPRLLRALDAGRNGDLEPTKELDWRCDLYSLAAMLKRYLPPAGRAHEHNSETGWSSQRYDEARALILRLRDSHDRDLPQWRPHSQLIDYTLQRLSARDLAASLADGWALAHDTIAAGIATPMTPITPMTRLAPAIWAPRRAGPATLAAPPTIADESMRMSAASGSESSRIEAPPRSAPTAVTAVIASNRLTMRHAEPRSAAQQTARRLSKRALPISVALASLVTIAVPSFVGDPEHPIALAARELMEAFTTPIERTTQDVVRPAEPLPNAPSAAPERFAEASAADQRAEPASINALSAPTNSQTLPKDAAPPYSALSSSAPPLTESISAGPQSEPQSAGLGKAPAANLALPPGNEPSATTDSTVSQALATSPTSDPPVPGGSSQVQRKKNGMPASRAQPTKRSSKLAPKPADASGRSYADAARRPAVHPAAGHARISEPTRRLDLAAITPAPSRPAPNTVTSPPAASPSYESVPRHADTPSVPESGTSENGPKHATVSAAPDAAPETTTILNGAGSASSEPSVARAEATPRRSVPPAQPREDWRTQLAGLFGVLRNRTGPAAPVEDRMPQTSGNGRAAVSRSPAHSATDALSRATPVANAATPATPTQSAAVASRITTPIMIESPTPAPSPAATMPLNDADARNRSRSVSDTTAAAPLPLEVRRPPVAETASVPRRVAAPPPASRDEAQDLTTQARRLLADTVPRVASLAQPEVSRVLSTAAIAIRPAQARLVIEAADDFWPSESAWIPVREAKPAYARRLHEQARRALASGGDVAEALDLELQAFGANPRDPDIAGYLAFLYLRSNPARPETARQLALHSIVFSGSRRSTRHAEWSTFAIASALTGRDVDSVRAFLADAALTSNVDRSCQAALRAYANYGEVLRAPVLAFFQRVGEQGRAYDAPSCMRSAYWNVVTRASSLN